MRKVIYAMSVSRDDFIEAANGDCGWSYPAAAGGAQHETGLAERDLREYV